MGVLMIVLCEYTHIDSLTSRVLSPLNVRVTMGIVLRERIGFFSLPIYPRFLDSFPSRLFSSLN